ncbi:MULTISPECIES: GNAT family N-acetyltransferase [unclassified Exiguobacterium]|uniref:GNAT family N-acetyltransferase n=1 Tax=unclassified Exiguobacterium TaxID=2644629 RepID=UPI000DF74C64|nr:MULTISPECIES: GNAT family N-acetyltransferase [unclassified Exiguobacterium]RDB34294.1 GNAT family N-acetyltransferase [Exiguobacterium sp. RIT594]HCN59371.1 GNAT family N-acetyltransferase [Exiguobacterium sp.]
MKETIEFVRCDVKDVRTLQAVSIETFSETFGSQNDPQHLEDYLNQSYNLEKLTRELEHPNSFFFFIKSNEEIAGYLKLNVGDAQTELMKGKTLELERIYIRSAYQGTGLGKQLLEKTFEVAQAQGMEQVWLGVWEENHRALRFYQRFGFVQTGAHSFFMGEDEQVDLILTKTL